MTAALRAVDAQHKEPQQGEQHRRQLLLAAAAAGASQLTGAQAAVRVCFFLWVSLLNLVGVSTLWARSADAFSPESAGRLFGLLGAGATLGQLLGSLAAGAMARAPLLGGGGGSPSLLPLLVSAAMLELAGQAAGRYHRVRPSGGSSSSGGAATSPLMAAVAVDAEGLARQATATGAGSSRSGSKAGGASSLARLGSGKASGLQEAADGSAGKSSPSAAANGSLKPSSGSRVTKPGASLLDQLMGRTLEGYRLIRWVPDADGCSSHSCPWPASPVSSSLPAQQNSLAYSLPASMYPCPLPPLPPAGPRPTLCTCAPTWHSTTSPAASSTLRKHWWWLQASCGRRLPRFSSSFRPAQCLF